MTADTASDTPASAGAFDGQVASPRSARGIGWGTQLLRVLVFAVILGLWQLAGGRWLPYYLISSPSDVAKTLWDLLSGSSPGLWGDIETTAEELVIGYVIGVVFGIAAGVLLGYWRVGAAIFNPLISAINGIPKIALAPLFLIWFGIGIDSKVAIASMSVFFVMFYNTYMGVSTMPQELVNVLRVFGASRWTVIRKVTLPQITVPLLAGMKASVPFAMIGVIVGEFIAAERGVGYLIDTATQNFDSATVFAGIVVLMVMMIIGMTVIAAIERHVLRWQRD
ncbi:MAG TPA: ABC transporter permease [Trebonia sp.]|jgi:NitT/TauT family transport system permease protein|nr:ABC transporter permease [Trebonia sp.]